MVLSFVRRRDPVSYTHLDVYKRQVHKPVMESYVSALFIRRAVARILGSMKKSCGESIRGPIRGTKLYLVMKLPTKVPTWRLRATLLTAQFDGRLTELVKRKALLEKGRGGVTSGNADQSTNNFPSRDYLNLF